LLDEKQERDMNDQQKLRDRTNAVRHGSSAGQKEQARGISPVNPSSMPRAEDDATTYANSPEYHDRMPNDPSKQQPASPERSDYAPNGTTKRPDATS
jgi:hypothetical protein